MGFGLAAIGAAKATHAALKYRKKVKGAKTTGRTRFKGNKKVTTFKEPGLLYGHYKKKHEQTIQSPPSGISHSYNTMVHKRKPFIKSADKLYEPTIYETVNATTLPKPDGLQGVWVTSFNLSFAPMTTTPLSQDLKVVTNQALLYLNAAGTTAASSQQQAFQASLKFILDSVNQTTTYTNQSLAGAELEIYDLVSRVSTPTVINPMDAWNNGLQDISLAQSTPSIFSVGATPTSSKKFNLTWKILKRTKVELGPGRSHEHVFVHKPGCVIDTEYFNTFNQVNNLTTCSMAIVKGQLVDSTVGLNLSKAGVVSTAETKVDCMSRTVTTVRPLSQNPRHYYLYNTLTTGNGGLDAIQEGSGLVVNTIGTEA